MLKKIISITGKPGLYEILSHGSKSIIVEDINSKKRTSVGAREKIIGLGDIAMYTENEDKPLDQILDLTFAYNNGEKIDYKSLEKEGKLKEIFGAILTDFDRDRVRNSDIKKLFSWYNLLVDAGFTKFTAEEDKDNIKSEASEEEKKEQNKE